MGGRPRYLQKLYKKILDLYQDNLEWHIGIQGNCDIGIDNTEYPILPWITLHKWDQNCGAGEANNRLIKHCEGELICKLDDDALPYGDYINHAIEINNVLEHKSIFSPYPVGLINNPGGVLSKDHSVLFSNKTDTFYTLRKVHHIGGFARIMPSKIAKSYTWPYDYCPGSSGKEDVNFSAYCNSTKISMFYLENSLIVEHQESTLGQHARYGETYFNGRF